MKYHITPMLWKHYTDKEGKQKVKIRVTINRKVVYKDTPFKLLPSQFKDGEAKGANSTYINAHIRKEISKIEQDLIKADMIGRVDHKKVVKAGTRILFSTYTLQQYSDSIAHKEVRRVKEFAGDDLALIDIDYSWLLKYERHEKNRGMANNTVNSTMKFMRRVLRRAYKEKVIPFNPFEEYSVPKYIQTDRTYLTRDEVVSIESKLDDMPGDIYPSACFFLLSCYTGLRHSDWAQFSPEMVNDDFLRFRAHKNKKHVVLPVGESLKKIIERVKELRPLSLDKSNEKLFGLENYLKFKKHLTCHVGRHTFGYTCAKLKIPREVTAQFMGVDLQTVSVYYHLAGEDATEHAAALKML